MTTPYNNPRFENFYLTIQYKYPHLFKVQKSCINTAGFGVFFKGIAKKGEKLCGYGGAVRNNDNKGHYVAKLSKTKYVIDAGQLPRQFDEEKYVS